MYIILFLLLLYKFTLAIYVIGELKSAQRKENELNREMCGVGVVFGVVLVGKTMFRRIFDFHL